MFLRTCLFEHEKSTGNRRTTRQYGPSTGKTRKLEMGKTIEELEESIGGNF